MVVPVLVLCMGVFYSLPFLITFLCLFVVVSRPDINILVDWAYNTKFSKGDDLTFHLATSEKSQEFCFSEALHRI